nr:hypothetical protein OG781_20540 [Streptomyces sp. NBC_00830]
MHPEMYLTMHRLRSAEMQQYADEFRMAQSLRAPRKDLRTQLGWTLVELGLRVIPNGRPLPTSAAPRTA